MKIQCPGSIKRVIVQPNQQVGPSNVSTEKGSNGTLIQHLRPLHLVSRLLSLNPFGVSYGSGKVVRISTVGIVQCVVACIAYGVFHLYTTYSDDFDTTEHAKNVTRNATDASEESAHEKQERNFVSVMIDMYNRYFGLGLYWILVSGAVGNRRILVNFMESLQQVDETFEAKLNVVVNNLHWKRVICIQMTLIFAMIFLFEYFNCIMYLSDFNPVSVYCLPDCYLVLLTGVTAESQIVGYIKLLQMRFQLINQLLTRFNESNLPAAVGEDSTSLSSLSKLVPLVPVKANPTTSSNDTKFELNELEPHHSVDSSSFSVAAKKRHHHSFQLLSDPTDAANNAFVKEIVPERGMWRPTSLRIDQPRFRRELCGANAAQTLHWENGVNAVRKLLFRNKKVNMFNPAGHTILRRIRNAGKHATSGSWFRRKGIVHPTISIKSPPNVINQQQHAFIANISEHWKQQSIGTEAQNHSRMEIINEIKNLYAHLHLLSLNINKAYGVQLVFILMTLFVTLTTLMYHCSMKAIRLLLHRPTSDEDLTERIWEVLNTFYWAAFSAYRIFRICNICNATKNEVKLFSLQLLQQKVEFTACGLFSIDHGLVFNIVGAVATYILILLQFDVAQNRSQWQRNG